jgi:transposase InsO family protein
MLISLKTLLTNLTSIFHSRAALQLENVALRHQIGMLQRSIRNRPKLTLADRLRPRQPVHLSDDYQAEIAFLGMQSSPSLVRQPEWHGCVERFIRTLNEQLLWVKVFQNVEELRCALAEFRERYTQRWIVQRFGYLTPAQARQQLLGLGAAA